VACAGDTYALAAAASCTPCTGGATVTGTDRTTASACVGGSSRRLLLGSTVTSGVQVTFVVVASSQAAATALSAAIATALGVNVASTITALNAKTSLQAVANIVVISAPAVSTIPAPPSVTAAPVAVVSAAVGLSGYTAASFGASAQTSFTAAMAAVLSVNTADITITGVTDWTPAAGRRHLLTGGVQVQFTVKAASSTAATALSTAVAAATTTNASTFVAALQSQGLTNVTAITQTVAPVVANPPPPAPAAASSAAGRSVARYAASACATALAVAALI
jgi:hypothetical protein